MEVVTFQGESYPFFQTLGNAAQFAIPYAKHFCKGKGWDIGFGKEEWKFPGARSIDQVMNDGYRSHHNLIYFLFHLLGTAVSGPFNKYQIKNKLKEVTLRRRENRIN